MSDVVPSPGSAGASPAPGAPGASPGVDHRGWHSRGFLPHFDGAGTYQSITFRLNDSLPQSIRNRIESELDQVDAADRDRERRRRIETILDAGHGSCRLKDPSAASMVARVLDHDHERRYDLHAWVVMPNHVHVLIRLRSPLSVIVQTWKSVIAHRLRRPGDDSQPLWQPDYWDRFIRDERHFRTTTAYIEHNPVTAGLVATPDAWAWSSAFNRVGRNPQDAKAGEAPATPGAGEAPATPGAGEAPALPGKTTALPGDTP